MIFKMETEYNWKAIMKGSLPVSLVMIYVFYSNSISDNSKWFYLLLGILAAAGITYYFDRKKHNIFTAPFVVVIVALIIHGLRKLGLV